MMPIGIISMIAFLSLMLICCPVSGWSAARAYHEADPARANHHKKRFGITATLVVFAFIGYSITMITSNLEFAPDQAIVIFGIIVGPLIFGGILFVGGVATAEG